VNAAVDHRAELGAVGWIKERVVLFGGPPIAVTRVAASRGPARAGEEKRRARMPQDASVKARPMSSILLRTDRSEKVG